MDIDPACLTGEKVFLREMTEADASFVVAWRNDPEIRKWMFNRAPVTLESHLAWFRQPRPDRMDFVICEKQHGQPIGTVNFINIQKDSAEAGKMLGDKTYWRRGYAKEAYLIWLRVGFSILGLKKVYGKTRIDNVANIKLNQKLGFEVFEKTKIKIDGDLIVEALTMVITKERLHG